MKEKTSGRGRLVARCLLLAGTSAALAIGAAACGTPDEDADAGVTVGDGGGDDDVADGAIEPDDGGSDDVDAASADTIDSSGSSGALLKAKSLHFDEDFRAVWGSSANDVWWVGREGRILHDNGATLTPLDPGTDKDLFAVWGRGPDDVWVVGDGIVLRWNGFVFHDKTPDGMESVEFRAVHAPADGSTVLIGGADGIILRVLEDGSLMQEETESKIALHGIWALNAGNAWAVGVQGQALRLSGGTWSTTSMPSAGPTIRVIGGSPKGRLFAAGDGGWLALTDGSTWKTDLSNDPKSRDLLGLWAVSDKDVWAVGLDGALVHFDGSKWNVRDIDGTYMKTGSFHGIWGTKTDDDTMVGYAVGDNGAGLRYADGKWLDREAETTADLLAVRALPDGRLVACGQSGLLLAAKDANSPFLGLAAPVDAADLHGVAGDGEGGHWVVGDGGVVMHSAADGKPTTLNPPAAAGANLRGVARLSDGKMLFVGDGGTVVVGDGDGFAAETTGKQIDLYAAAAAGDDAWAVGDLGAIFHRDKDGAWSKEPTGETGLLHDIVAWGDGSAAAAGEGGLVLVRSGGSWQKAFESPGLFLYGITRLKDGRLLAVGWAGALVIGEGASFKKLDSKLPNVLQGVAATATGTIAVGKKGGIYQVAEKLP